MKQVVADLYNSDWRMRESAVEILLHSGHFPDDVVEMLRQLIKTEAHENVRRQVVTALAAANPPDLTELLLEVLEDSDYIVRSRAFSSLTKILPGWRDEARIQAYMEAEVHPLGMWHIKDATKP
jgi:HEAT repeat protein